MAKDDYHVIVYKILSYLYEQLKNGEPVDQEMLEAHGKQYDIPVSYWNYIFNSLFSSGYIACVNTDAWGGDKIALSDIQITPAGIEYLTDNSFMQKVKVFAKEATGIITLFK